MIDCTIIPMCRDQNTTYKVSQKLEIDGDLMLGAKDPTVYLLTIV